MNLTKQLTSAIIQANQETNGSHTVVYEAISKCLDLKLIEHLVIIDDTAATNLQMVNARTNDIVLTIHYDIDSNMPEYVLKFFRGLDKTLAVKSYCTWFKINVLSKEVSYE